MKPLHVICLSIVVAGCSSAGREEAAGRIRDYPYQPVSFTRVRVDDAFWKPRLETNRTATIPCSFRKCEETGRIENFKVAGGLSDGCWKGGFGFNDSDVSKIIEGASCSLRVRPDPELDRYLDEVIRFYAAAQEEDGYLYTAMTCKALDGVRARPHGKRWDNLGESHELYNAGHMYEAAVAHWQATGKRSFLDVAVKNAELVARTFGPGEGQKIDVPGHQEIEIGLVKLFRVTGEEKYLDLARFFLDMRGRKDLRSTGGQYNQDHEPVTKQIRAVGHAVRAGYMYSSMTDIAALTGDPAYRSAVDRLWKDVVETKSYLIGSVGVAGHGEGFGDAYELPNRRAYCETCAAIAFVMWNHRMFLLHGEAKYIDVLERSLYNGVISGVSLDGKKFFYPNPLASLGGHARRPWFGCSCCPSNICRFMPSIPGYVYATRDSDVYVNLYIAGEGKIGAGKGEVIVRQETRYPWEGRVKLAIEPGGGARKFTLKLRIPGWAAGEPMPGDLYRFLDRNDASPALEVNGEPVPVNPVCGYAAVRRTWKSGDEVVLHLPMPIRRVVAHDRVEADRGRVALQRGPVVHCVEWSDVSGGRVENLLLPDDADLHAAFRPDMLGGVQVVTGRALATRRMAPGGKVAKTPVTFTAIPYHVWAHRGRGEMAVWLARCEEAAVPLPAPTIASRARATSSGGNARALNDQREPKSSNDHTHPFLHWWPRKGTVEWVQYEFTGPRPVHRVEVYWFDDTGRGACRLPASWKLEYRKEGTWHGVAGASGHGCAGDRYNVTTFDEVTTDALRLVVQLQEKWAGGIHEWRVE